MTQYTCTCIKCMDKMSAVLNFSHYYGYALSCSSCEMQTETVSDSKNNHLVKCFEYKI